MIHQYDEFVNFANILADESAEIIGDYFRKKININNKKDDSPVTIADQNTELKIRELISKKYPSHGILGEEYENTQLNSEFVWVIDPIDGTRSFIAGHKDFGTLIALLHNNKPVLGIINCPAHQERWVGIKNEKTRLNNQVIKTSAVKKIKDAYLFTSGIYFNEPILKKGYQAIRDKSRYFRLGGDCYMYGMLASGLIDIVIEDTLKAHDYMALVNVIEGAGGKITDKFGKDVTIQSDGSLIASSSSEIHNELINIINN
tara:strand:- start:1023 stop:1799 length:777 start_codon:yes stop_codon:yes gene_type:complete